jgi:hypothetical protein
MISGQPRPMRRVVHDYIAASVSRAKPDLERYIAQHLHYPEPFPFALTDPSASILELRGVKITPRFRADYPPVDISLAIHVSMTARTRKADADLGMRTFAIDVELDALGTVQGYGYDVTPRQARMTAWWGYRE